jgi:quercetin dioxygenase-like cupin family protein
MTIEREEGMSDNMRSRFVATFVAAAVMSVVSPAFAQQTVPPSPVTRTELLKQVLPAGDFRDVQAVMIELAPGAVAPVHRHDVAVLAYVLEGVVENRFDAGPLQTHKVGQSWWEAPGTVHNVARNVSKTDRARLLVVYIGEPGKAPTVPLEQSPR